MSSSVSYIFKTLIKIPIIIVICYMIFNAFAFGFTYFRLLGFSYVVMQTAVENNYLPPEEIVTLNNYLDSITDTGVVGDAALVLEESESGVRVATDKRQYGMPVTVGVTAQYKFIWPLTPKEQLRNEGDEFIGYGPGQNESFSGYANGATLEARRKEIADNEDNNIRIVYTVPGLKYYPDLN